MTQPEVASDHVRVAGIRAIIQTVIRGRSLEQEAHAGGEVCRECVTIVMDWTGGASRVSVWSGECRAWSLPR